MAGNGQKRIAKEFAEVSQNLPSGMQVSLLNESNLFNWNIILSGPPDSPYSGGKFTLSLSLPPEYPFKPPKLAFKTRIYHPNVTFDEHGSMCIGLLKPDAWKPSSRILNILLATQQMLEEPMLDDAVETTAADQYTNNHNLLMLKIRCLTKKTKPSDDRYHLGWDCGGKAVPDFIDIVNDLNHTDTNDLLVPSRDQFLQKMLHHQETQRKTTPRLKVLSTFPSSPTHPPCLVPSQAPCPSPKDFCTSPTNRNYPTITKSHEFYRDMSGVPRHQKPNHDHRVLSPSSEHFLTSDKHDVVSENFSRPRQCSLKGKNEPCRSPTTSIHTPTLPKHHEEPTEPIKSIYCHRALSTASATPSPPVAPSIKSLQIPSPKLTSSETINDNQRSVNSTNCMPIRIDARSDQNKIPDSNDLAYQYPLPIHNGSDVDEIHSIESVLTTSSNFQGNYSTDRIGDYNQEIQATSDPGDDEGMSVDDAIEMYEKGFNDSLEDTQHKLLLLHKNSDNKKFPKTNLISKNLPALPLNDQQNDRDSEIISEKCLTPISLRKLDISDVTKEVEPWDDAASVRPVSSSVTTQFDDTRDRYGFRKKTQYVSLDEYEAWNKPYMLYLNRRKQKWITLMRQHNLPTITPEKFPPRSDKVKRFIRKGIPPSWRGAAWFHYAGGPAMLNKNPGVYGDLVRRSLSGDMTETDDEIIERDLNRTFPDNIKFKPDPDLHSPEKDKNVETPILQSLRRVLRAFSIYHPKIGYCQSLNFLAGLLLLFMTEEKSFWMLNIITRIFLPGTHSLTLEGANVDLGVLMSSVKEMMPSVWAKIGNELDGKPSSPSAGDSMRLPPITLCTTAWFMSCFIGTLPIETTLRVWDSFFYEGSKTLFRIALTIFKLGEPQIRLVNDPMEIFQVVQCIPRSMMDCNLLMQTCFKRRGGFVKLSQDDIERGREERRRNYALEREKLSEQNDLKLTTTSTKIRLGAKRGTTIFGRGKKQRVGLPVTV